MAALLDQGAASVLREPVPVTDLFEKRKPVFADCHHLWGSDRTGGDLLEQAGDRRHVAILESDPGYGTASLGEVEHLVAMLDRRTEWLFNEDVQVGGEQVAQHVDVGHVR